MTDMHNSSFPGKQNTIHSVLKNFLFMKWKNTITFSRCIHYLVLLFVQLASISWRQAWAREASWLPNPLHVAPIISIFSVSEDRQLCITGLPTGLHLQSRLTASPLFRKKEDTELRILLKFDRFGSQCRKTSKRWRATARYVYSECQMIQAQLAKC